MLVCNRCDKTTRIGGTASTNSAGAWIVCKKCGETYDRAQV